MATLGSLTLKIRSTRKLLALDLLQSRQEIERFRETANDLLTLKAGVSIDWDSFSKAESEIRRWVDSLPNPDLQVTAAFKDADLTQGIKDLERLLNNPLKIQVDDQRLFELNQHFKLKERDYRHLQSVLDSPLSIKVDRTQLDNLSRDLRSIENTPKINLQANVDLTSLRRFHEQLNRYTQGRTLELATSVSRTTLNALQNDLKGLASNLTTARVSVQIDSQLQALRSELGNLPNVSVGVSIDDSALGEFDRKLSNRKLGLGVDTKDLGKSIQDAVQGGFKGNSSLLGTIASPFKSILRGAFEGAGRDLFGGVSKSFSEAINNALANTIGSTDLVGRKLGEKAVNKFQQIGYQLAAEKPAIGAASSLIQKEIRSSLGERDVAIEANKARGKQAKQKQQDLAVAREGITEERKAARENLQIVEKNAVKTYRDVKPLQDEIDRRLVPDRQKQIALNDIRVNAYDLSPIQKLRLGGQETVDLDSANKKLRKRLTGQGLPIDVVESRVSAETERRQEYKLPENRTLSPKIQGRILRFQERINLRREEFQPAQDLIDGRMEATQSQLSMARDRSAAVDAQAKLLRRKQQSKLYQNILDEIAPNLPDHLVPKLVANPNAQAEGEYGRYNVVENQIYLDPRIHSNLESGKRLTQTEYKTVREELEHAKDLKFGQFAGYQSLSERRLIGKPVKATPAEEAAVSLQLKGYAEDVKPFERNAKIKTNRAYDRYANESRLEDINNYVGAGGRKFSRQALNQFKAAETGLNTAQEVAQAKGVKLLALDKLETGVRDLKLEHLRLVEEIHKAQAGTLSPPEVQKLESDLIAHTNRIVSTRGRIKNVGKAVVKVANRQDAAKAKTSFEANRGSWDDLLSLDTIGSKAKDAATNLGGSIVRAGDRALTSRVNNLLTQVPGQPGVIDYGAGVDSLSQLTISDYGKMARLGLQGTAGVAQKAGAFLQGAENVALGILPGGKAAKKVIQNTALPAAAFATATHSLPGGQVAAHALQGGLQSLLSLPGAGMGAAANGLIGSTIGQLPMLGGAAGAATSALVSGGIDLATSGAAGLLAPVLGGKLMLNAGQKAFKAIAPQQDNNKLLIAGQQTAQTALNLPQKLAEPAYHFVESGRELLQAASSKLISQSIEPLHPQLQSSKQPERKLQSSPGLAIRLMPAAKPKTESPATTAIIIDIEAQNIGSKEAIEYAKKIQAQTKFGKEQLKEALKAGDKQRAEQIAKILKKHLDVATTELDEIRKVLGSEAAMGTDAGNQLAQTKSVITRTSNDLTRSIAKDKLNLNNESLSKLDPELESLSRKRQPRARKYNPKQDPEAAGFEAIGFAQGAQEKFDRAEDSIKNRESKILQNQYGFQGIEKGYDPLNNLVTGKIDEAKNKLSDLKDMGAKVISGFAAFTGIAFVGGIISKIGAQAITAAASFQDLKLAVSAATSSKITADQLISRSSTQANQLGYNYQSAIESDTAFAAATKGTPLELVSGNIARSLRQYNRVLGVSEERQKLSQIAVQQMAGKGTLAAEEVFGQLAESSPGAVNVLARSQGLTLAQLRARMQEGGLNSADTLSRFGMQLDAESVNSVDGASKSTSATIGKVQNSLLSLQTSVGGQLLAPATAGLNTFNDALKLTEANTDSIAKLTIANFAVLGSGALILAGKLLPIKFGFDTIGAGISALSPHLLKFIGQTALVYVALETLTGVWGQFQNTSPLKGLSDDLDIILAKIKQGASEAGKSIAELRTDKFSKNLSTFEQVQDIWRKAQRTLGADVTLNAEARTDQDTVTADQIIDKTQAIYDNKPDLKIAETQAEREGLALELAMLRARRATLTSRDRDELQSNSTREQVIIDRQTELDRPITTRQADLTAGIKANRAIADGPLAADSARARAKQRIAEDETAQRQLQVELSRSSDKLSDLPNGLRQLTFESSSALKSIDQNSQIKSTQAYQSASLDPRNTGALQGSQAQIEIEKISARRDVKQVEVNKIRSKLTENSDLLAAGNINPDTASKEQLDHFKAINQDALSQQVVASVQQYQQVKQELADSNQGLFQAQFNYIKSLADYNKGSIDQVISLSNRLANLSLTARNAIASLQQQVEQTLVEINTTSSKAVFQAQRNQIQTAYNKFLEKLGISTDDIFDHLFTSYNSILDTVQQLTERQLAKQSSAITAKYRQVGNETRKEQIQTEQTQSINELKRQESERQLANPLNRFSSGDNQSLNNSFNPSETSSPVGEKLATQAEQTLGLFKDIPVQCANSIREIAKQAGIPLSVTTKPADFRVVGNQTNPARANSFGGENDQIINRKQDLKRGDVVQWKDTYAGINGIKNDGEITHVGVYLGDGKYWHHNKKAGTRINDASGLQFSRGIRVGGAVAQTAAPQTNQYTDVTSSFYTPGEGGAINGAKTDIRGKYIDRHSMVMATRTTASPQGIPYGATVELRNPQNGNTATVKNVDRGTLRPGRDIDLTPAPAAKLGITADGVAKLQMRVISVPQGQLKPEYDLGGGIGSYDRNGNYTGKSGTIVRTESTVPAINNPIQPAGKGALGEGILNNVYQQGVDQKTQENINISDKYISDINRLSDRDTKLANQKQAQETNLSNQQNNADRLKLDTQGIKDRNFIDRELPKFNRETTQLERKNAAQNRAQDRTPYQQIDRVNQQYGGIRDTSILDTSIPEAQTTIDRLTEESRANREALDNRIRIIQARGVGAIEAAKIRTPKIAQLRRQGNNADADREQAILDNMRRVAGTPEFQRQTIASLTKQGDTLPSDAVYTANQLAPGTSKVLTNIQSVTNQYLPKTFQDNLDAEARSIVERFKSVKQELQTQLELINGTIKTLEAEIQTKLQAAGYAPQKLDLTNPERLKLLRTVAPAQTAVLEQETAKRLKLNLSSQYLDRNTDTAAAQSVSIGQKRQQLQVDGLSTDYLAATQDGNLFSQIKIDKERFTQGKAELDLEFPKLDATNIDLYNAKLNKLTLETNTLRNAILPLRGATTGFFDDIFKGQGVFDGLGNAVRNLTVNILKNFQDMISKHLGQQLFGSLEKSVQNIQTDANNPKSRDFLSFALQSAGLATPGAKPSTNAGLDLGLNTSLAPWSNPYLPRQKGLDIGLNDPILPPPSTSPSSVGGSLLGFGLNLGLGLLGLPSIPGFATGGMVTSPTLALVGEGINNEAIVPLPNGRSIPVDLKGAGESVGSGNVNSSVSVTIQNSGQARETSKGEGQAISQMIRGAVMDVLISERRIGGLLA